MNLLLLVTDVVVLVALILLYREVHFVAVVFVVLLIIGNTQAGMYRNRFTLSLLDDLPALATRYVLAAGVTLFVLVTLGRVESPPVSLFEWGFAFVALMVARLINYAVIRHLRSHRMFGKRTLIVGCGVVGTSLAFALRRERQCGLDPIGFVDSPPPGLVGDLPYPLIGPIEDLPALITRYRAEVVLVAYPHVSEHAMVPIIRLADRLPASFKIVPRLFELVPVKGTMDVISDIPLVRLPRPAFRSPFWPVKRTMDVVLSGLALIVLSPLLAALAIIDRIVDGPGVIFRQERIGVDGKPIELLKFRSLRPVDTAESETKWNIKNDDRVSWFGKFLRKSSLDELPQLLNIFRGDMSIVGPRPERPHFADQFSQMYPYYGSRHRVPCGLTGWAQIHGLRGDTSIAGRARYDNFYIENWSLWLDAKIVLRTISSLTKGSG
ncbi:MAG: hypothetical protein QG597_3181 [Actinomycetota bacterium]|nr:hypothetical protein [Actinomycetota bacterium]